MIRGHQTKNNNTRNIKEEFVPLFYMIDYLLAVQPPGKGVDPAESDLSGVIANIALVVGILIAKPAIEQHFRLAIDRYTSITLDNRQALKAVVGARRDSLLPTLDALHLKVKPPQAAIATAVTVVKLAPTPVQVFQEQSFIAPLWGIFACAMFALIGTFLVFEHYRQGASIGWSSPSGANSSNSTLEPFSRDSTPPNDNFSDDSSGSGGHPPPLPVFDIFYDPVLRLNKATDTGDEKQVRERDGAPPPPPPSSSTPVEDGDASKSNPSIFKWLTLTLLLSIITFAIKRLFNFKKHGNKLSTPTASERITVDEIFANVTMFPSATADPVIQTTHVIKPISVSKSTPVGKPTCPNLLPLVESERPTVNISTPVKSLFSHPVCQRSRKFMTVVLSLLLMSFLLRMPFIARYFLDYRLKRMMNSFFATPIPRRSLKTPDVVESTGAPDESVGVDHPAGIDVEASSLPAPTPIIADEAVIGDEDDVSIDEANAHSGNEEPSARATGSDVDAVASNDKEDFTAGTDEDGAGISVTSRNEETDDLAADSDEASITTGDADSMNGPGRFPEIFHTLTVDAEGLCASIHAPSPAPGRFLEFFHTLTLNADGLYASIHASNPPPKPDSSASIHAPIPPPPTPDSSTSIRTPSSPSTPDSSASSRAPSPPPPTPDSSASVHTPSSSPMSDLGTSIHASRSPPRSDLRASIHAPSPPPKRDSSASIHAPSALPPTPDSSAPSSSPMSDLGTSIHAPRSPPRSDLRASIHAPSPPPRPDSSASIHTPCFASAPDSSASIHAPSSPPRPHSSASIHTLSSSQAPAPSSPPRPHSSASIHTPSSPSMPNSNLSIHAPCTPPRKVLNTSIHAPTLHEPFESFPIPVIGLSPERRTRRVIDPKRQCEAVVLVSEGIVLVNEGSVSP